MGERRSSSNARPTSLQAKYRDVTSSAEVNVHYTVLHRRFSFQVLHLHAVRHIGRLPQNRPFITNLPENSSKDVGWREIPLDPTILLWKPHGGKHLETVEDIVKK